MEGNVYRGGGIVLFIKNIYFLFREVFVIYFIVENIEVSFKMRFSDFLGYFGRADSSSIFLGGR